jgi:general secretion pathway protein G
MTMIVRTNPQNVLRRREAFTLLEVLVVVAILVILASVAGIYVFRYLDDARYDTTLMKMKTLEQCCKAYAVKNGGNWPENLQLLIQPPDGGSPFVENGQQALLDSWGQQINYTVTTYSTGEVGPQFTTVSPKGQTIVWPQKQ